VATESLIPTYEPEAVTACPKCETIYEVCWVECPRCRVRPTPPAVEDRDCKWGRHDWNLVGTRYGHSLFECGRCTMEIVTQGHS
jgi:hypothetical protein